MSIRAWRAKSLQHGSAASLGEAALLEIQRLAAIHREGKQQQDRNLHGEQEIKDHANRIRQCGRAGDLAEAERVHAAVLRSGLGGDRFLSNLLVEMYGRCGGVEGSRTAFDAIESPNVYSWTLLIAAYARNGHHREAIEALRRMDLDGVEADTFTYSTIFNMISRKEMLPQARWLHERVSTSLELGLNRDIFLGTAIVNMYGKCGSIHDAEEIFFRMEHRDVVAWNAMLSAYAHNGYELEAAKLFQEMEHEGVKADRVVFVSLLEACSKLGDLEQGKVVHGRVTELGFEAEDVLGHALVAFW
ncbi:pentatricopeptide repeat-containing protein At2g33760-like [Selaginella moellendorffii]|uniref:pentatricopeptide repeat-containing protein At2g33760-like n=1 Tax=Selaginella moellendorffii TaxID=88036 RepID=UPI000D1C4C05|nr:pentatricopeptide repeat-containing protein At2g33760-like [Selaginella moellendorffii]|eukprot:XP_024536115.1 pentatricopeptide repeat-containing protein At2g33760-like [Selaginella moellendorffii]